MEISFMHKKLDAFSIGVVFMLGSATCLALIGLFGKLELNDLSLPSLLFWRYACAFLLCLLWVQRHGKLHKTRLPLSSLRLHIARAALVLGAQYSFFYCLQGATLLNATVLLHTGPLFIPFLDRFLLHKRVGKSTWVGVLIAFIGILCILQPDYGVFSFFGLIGLLSGLFQGSSQLVLGAHAQAEKSDFNVLFQLFFCALFSLIPYSFLPSNEVSLPSGHTFLLIGAIGLASVASQLLRTEAYRHGTPARLAPFFYFSVVLSGCLDVLVFHNIPNLLSFLGVFLVFLGGFLKIYLRGKSWKLR